MRCSNCKKNKILGLKKLNVLTRELRKKNKYIEFLNLKDLISNYGDYSNACDDCRNQLSNTLRLEFEKIEHKMSDILLISEELSESYKIKDADIIRQEKITFTSKLEQQQFLECARFAALFNGYNIITNASFSYNEYKITMNATLMEANNIPSTKLRQVDYPDTTFLETTDVDLLLLILQDYEKDKVQTIYNLMTHIETISKNNYKQGFAHGDSNGYNYGYNDGHSHGYDSGYHDGYHNGYNDGEDDGSYRGYKKGYSDAEDDY